MGPNFYVAPPPLWALLWASSGALCERQDEQLCPIQIWHLDIGSSDVITLPATASGDSISGQSEIDTGRQAVDTLHAALCSGCLRIDSVQQYQQQSKVPAVGDPLAVIVCLPPFRA